MDLAASTALLYADHAFDQMLEVASRLGDQLANERPVGPGTNTVAALIVHCCGVAEYWTGHVALAEPTERVRDAEFTAVRSVDELRDLVASTRARFGDHVRRLEAGDGRDEGGRQFLHGGDTSDAAVVLHVIEELYQHLGHMELTADVLLRDDRATQAPT